MNFPSKILIAGLSWAIVEDNNDLKEKGLYGQTRAAKEEIALETVGRSPQRVRETLLHEIVHACSGHWLNGDDGMNERQCRIVASALFDTLCRNPDVTDFILGRENHAPETRKE